MNEVNNENYKDRLSYLTNEVNKVSYNNNNDSNIKSSLYKNINYKIIIMISLPILITIFLLVLKPGFIKTKKNKEETGEKVSKVSYIRIVIIIFIVCIIEFLINFFVINKNVLKPKIIA